MLLRASPSLFFSLSSSSHEASGISPISPSSLSFRKKEVRNGAVTAAAAGTEGALTGVIFQPFQEVQKELNLVPTGSGQSLARQRYNGECEAAVNEQINVEYNVSYAYHAMFAYFDRDDVALKGIAEFCKEMSQEERDHAEKLMEYQNMRGGKVKLLPIVPPLTEFNDEEKGDALCAFELALSFEKLVNEKLLSLHKVASDSDDVQMADFIESEFLGEQVESIKKISEYVSQLRRVGKGHGVWHFDQMLLHEGDGK